VGKPVDGAEIKIADDGEVLARGPMLMQGYLNQPEESSRAIDAQGYFHTGDIGVLDADGFLRITGRKKSIFKLSTGKYVSPEPIENGMVHELVAQTMVCGENQKVAGALVFPHLPALRQLGARLGVADDVAALCKTDKIRAVYKGVLDQACAELADFEKVKVFALVPATLAIDSGELTPTLKLKRGVVSQKFAAEIGAMFAARRER
jgi:long-chain acyl-CoA synthetase